MDRGETDKSIQVKNNLPKADQWRKLDGQIPILFSDNIVMVNMLNTIEPERINTISADATLEELVFSVDSGAIETVSPGTMLTSIQTPPGAAIKIEVHEAANMATIPNDGEKRSNAFTDEGRKE